MAQGVSQPRTARMAWDRQAVRGWRGGLAAAPYALAAAVSLAASRLTTAAAEAVRDSGTAALPGVGALVVFLATLAAGALACAGRWPLARAVSALPVI
ncbi:hypothetical protein AB0I94_28145 [Streptomyces sp. NPDC050147]|uniref:hypothetical protein n=1 Tax=Streptomyces sp. NPDC050147 TaxID=3155513 RepID=UPI003448C59B